MRVDFCLKHKFQISLHAVALRQAVIRVSLLFGQFPSPCILEVVVVEIPVLLESHTFHLYSETTHGQTHSDLQLRQLSLQATSQGSSGAVGGVTRPRPRRLDVLFSFLWCWSRLPSPARVESNWVHLLSCFTQIQFRGARIIPFYALCFSGWNTVHFLSFALINMSWAHKIQCSVEVWIFLTNDTFQKTVQLGPPLC